MRHFLLSLALVCATVLASAADYYRISSFPIDGADIRDTFLIVVEYAGNTYIWNGQEATGKNYVCLQNYSADQISGDYADNEVAIVHNQWHSYYKLFSVLCKGDGDRENGYYLGGVSGNNGISFSKGQVDAEITFEDTEGIKIATKSGVGIFRFNITPNDPHGFKFYQNATNMLYPTLYVKGKNARYLKETEYEDMSDLFSYAQADYYEDKTLATPPTVHEWDFRLYAADNEEDFPQIYLKLTNDSKVKISGTYSSTVADGQPWQVYCTNSSKKSSTFAFLSDGGNVTTLYLKHCTLQLTPVSKDAKGVYTYLIDLKWVDQNNKHRMVYKQLPIIGQLTTHVSDNKDDTSAEMFFNEDGVPDGIATQEGNIDLQVVEGAVICAEHVQIFNLVGQNVTAQNGNLKQGVYVVKTASKSAKVVVR
ncbi:MAG: hypothetical protein IKN91_01200 [Paludibacteraceae bacterium]|nr:hypothetical protein [Paludibacteraceae bacterium]